ncbi:tRNA (cytosine-5-)-methyltransferase ncl1 [Blastocladiella emersonii ATCC 22665]|nr:tRNA (cytosine-5-)-methyltransferase ncl1 [Blastocladiella emersonii ATCC 22665]
MARGGKRGGRGGGRGGKGGAKQERKPSPYENIVMENANFEKYYQEQKVIPEAEWDAFMTAMRSPLPVTFRFTGSSAYAKALAENCRTKYFPSMQNVEVDGVKVEPPSPLPWYPNQLGYQYDVGRATIRRVEGFKRFHQFLIAETETGNISRQEAVSMIPPLLLDVQPHHRVLDMCAAPGSKTAQLVEALHADAEAEGTLPSGLVMANDADNKRAYMLVRQVKRLQSPNLLVVNHDAQYLPNTFDPETDAMFKFDRILADVPCSGDGTLRKNPGIWREWGVGQSLSLHILQLRILMRAIALTKPGGRIVYSTCTMNPIENEAVVATALKRCGGAVKLVDASSMLPELKRRPGLSSWRVPSFKQRGKFFYDSYDEIAERDDEKVRLIPSMFAPEDAESLGLEHCLRIYPHLQNTGAFFVAVLQKDAEPVLPGKTQFGECPEDFPIKAPKKNRAGAAAEEAEEEEADVDMASADAEEDDSTLAATLKRKAEEELDDSAARKQAKTDKDAGEAKALESRASAKPGVEQHFNAKSFEEPFIFLNKDDAEVKQIVEAFGLPATFPCDQLVVRSTKDDHRAIYFCSKAVKEQLLAKNASRLRVVNTGVRLMSRTTDDKAAKDTCTHRFNTDGMSLMAPFLTKRIVHLDYESLKVLLSTDRPLMADIPSKPVRKALADMTVGGAVARADDPTGGPPMWFSLWRAPVSAGLLVNKKERVSLLTRFELPIPAEFQPGQKARDARAAAAAAKDSEATEETEAKDDE